MRVIQGHPFGVGQDPADEHPGEEEIGGNDDAAETKPHGMAETRLHQREGDAGVNGLPPSEPETLHEHPCHLGDIGIGIGIGGAPSDHHQQGVMEGHLRSSGQRLTDPGRRRADHVAVNAELTPVVDAQSRLSAVGPENRGDVVLGMAGGKQHRRNGQNMVHTLGTEGVERIPENRPGEFEIAMGHGHRSQALPELLRQRREFGHRQTIAAAMPTDQNPQSTGGAFDGKRRRGKCHA